MELVSSSKRLGIVSRPYRSTFIDPAYTLTRGLPSPRNTYPSASSISYPPPARWVRPKAAPTSPILGLTRIQRYWNINQLCIDYASRPRLSSRLTLGGLAFPRNPWTFGGGASHPSFATHANILTRPRSTTGYPAASQRDRRSATARINTHPWLRYQT